MGAVIGGLPSREHLKRTLDIEGRGSPKSHCKTSTWIFPPQIHTVAVADMLPSSFTCSARLSALIHQAALSRSWQLMGAGPPPSAQVPPLQH
jgi:hypothetical protein